MKDKPFTEKTVSAQDICDLLNSFLALDPEGIRDMMRTRFPCSERLATEHPTIQAGKKDGKTNTTSVLSLLNGLFERRDDGFWPISYAEEDRKIIKFLETPWRGGKS